MAHSRRSVAIFVATMAMGATLPIAASQSMKASTVDSELRTQDGTVLQLHRSYSLRDRYDYNRALRLYDIQRQQGVQGLVRPDINDRSTIDLYLKGTTDDHIQVDEVHTDPVSTKDYVKPEEEQISQQTLTKQERMALSRAEKIGRCDDYPGFSSGYMAQCKKFIQGKAVINTMGFGNDIINAKIQQQAKLRGSASSPANIYDGLKDNRSGGRIVPYGKNNAGQGMTSSSSSSVRK